tara:strand:- start:119 stop:340 length:222 start_codon:yes stop_codon:yes gene_type:complete
MEEQSRTILDYEVLQHEIAKAWKVLPSKVGQDLFINQDINDTVNSIFEILIYDYAMAKKQGLKIELNYELAEA